MASLENRGGGSWRIVISNGYDAQGRKKFIKRTIRVDPSKTLLAQQREAQKQAALIEADFQRQILTEAKKVSFATLYPDYIQDRVVRRGLTQRTRDSYEKLFKQKLIPEFGKMAVREIKAKDLNKFFRKMQDDDLAGTYQLKYYQQLHEFFVYAQRSGVITINPCDLIDPPKRDTKEAGYYDKSEVPEILTAIKNHPDPEWKTFFLLCIYCGARPGEILGLNWDDYSEKKIYIQAGSYQGKGQKTIRTARPKTKSGIREIVLSPDAISALDSWKSVQAEKRLRMGKAWKDTEAIFTNDYGERASEGRPSKEWKAFTEKNNIRHLPLYDLRHTHCSLLIYSRELSVEEVAARMGHKQTSTTLNIYSHAFSDASERATNALLNVIDSVQKKAE